MFARDSVIPFLRYHFQILFSMIMSQPLQKICRNVYPTSLHLLLEFIIPSPGEEICQVEFFLVQFYNFNNCFKFYYFVEATWKDFNRGPFEKLKITSPRAALLVFHFFKPVPSLLLMKQFLHLHSLPSMNIMVPTIKNSTLHQLHGLYIQ